MATAKEGSEPPSRSWSKAHLEFWHTKDGEQIKLKEMASSHLMHTIVKMERDRKTWMGQNYVPLWQPAMMQEVEKRGIQEELKKYRVADAYKHGDVRRLVKAVAEGERNAHTQPQTKGDIP